MPFIPQQVAVPLGRRRLWASWRRRRTRRSLAVKLLSARRASRLLTTGALQFLTMVTFTYRNDTVDEVDLGDENGDGSPVRTANPSSSVLGGADRTFPYYLIRIYRCGAGLGQGCGTSQVHEAFVRILKCLFWSITDALNGLRVSRCLFIAAVDVNLEVHIDSQYGTGDVLRQRLAQRVTCLSSHADQLSSGACSVTRSELTFHRVVDII
jgi:hypothetical protein